MSGEPSFQIDVSFRNFKFTRGYAVKGTLDVLTELITNACDAYIQIDPNNLMDKVIYIIFHRVPNADNNFDYYLQVTDNATGVEPSRMKSCFLVAGEKTSNSELARGFFSTGAKNITIMGDVYYTSMREKYLSQVYLDDQVYGHIVTHGPYDVNDPTKVPDVIGLNITDNQRKHMNIPKNGMNVILKYTNTAEIAKFTSVEAINEILTGVSKVATLRNIFANKKMIIMKDIRTYAPCIDIVNAPEYILEEPIIHTDPNNYVFGTPTSNFGGLFYERLTYSYPEGNLLLSVGFIVPNYPLYGAKFVMYKTDKPIPQPDRECQMEFGFLMKDTNAIHEINTLDDRYRWNPNINYIYGYIHCDGFAKELAKYDAGLTDELILDPNRVGGLNHNHSLYTNIMSVCLPRLDKAILEVQNSTSFQSINIQDLDTIVNKLQDLGVEVFNNNNVTLEYTPDKEGALAIALQKTDPNIVEEITGTIYVKTPGRDTVVFQEIIEREGDNPDATHAYYVDENNELQVVNIPPATDPVSYANAIHDVTNSITDISMERPYVYTYENGTWVPNGVFLRGKIERPKDYNASSVTVQKKSLSIQFINDINHNARYIIDTTNGITIKINLHNTLVAAKLANCKMEVGDSANFDISSNASYDALQFLETLMIDAFTDIVVDSDGKKGILGDVTPMKVLDYWSKVAVQIEPYVHSLFMNYITEKKTLLQTKVSTSIETAKTRILELFQSPGATLNDVEAGATSLAYALNIAMMSIL